jgi:PAS domain S-box-containing protein
MIGLIIAARTLWSFAFGPSYMNQNLLTPNQIERFTPILTFLAYCVTAAISNRVTTESGFAAVIWPPMGIAVAGLLLENRKTVAVIFIAAVIFSYRTSESSLVLALTVAASETLGALAGAWTIRKITNFDWTFGDTSDVWKFFVRTVIASSVITPIVGTPMLVLLNALHTESITENFITWWLGNALGILIFTPFALIVSKDALQKPFKKKSLEYAILYVTTMVACCYLFIDAQPIAEWMPQIVRRIYLLFPLILWAAIRFGPLGTASLLLGIAALATYGASINSAVFAATNTPETFNSMQLYIGFLAGSGFLVAANVTQSKRNEARFRSMFEMGGVPSALMDARGRFKLINDQFCNMTGYSRSELLEKGFADITHQDDLDENIAEFKKLILRQKKSLHFEKRYIVKSGETIWALVDATLINDSAPEDVTSIAIIQDITTRKLAELAAEKAKKDSEEANQAKSEFLAFMSHEIRTPLGVILGFAEILRNKDINQNLRDEFAETIHRNALELGSLIDDVLDLSKVEAGRVELSRDMVNLSELFRDIKGTFSLEAKRKNLEFNLTMDDHLPETILSDHKILRQILVNIVGNAVKYTEKGSVSISVSQQSMERTDSSLVVFTIKDTGCGISASERSKLFKAFGQTRSKSSTKQQGTGLGLILSKKLAILLGGDVELKDSKPGQGSTFVVTINSGLLSQDITSTSIPKTAAKEAPTEVIFKRLEGTQILVAEDTPDQALLIEFLLKDVGASVTVVNNGAGAVEKILSSQFDIILMDMQMPILDGFDATRLLRREGFKKPIIALTAQALKSDTERALEAGCNRHLSKPFTQDRLIQAIEETLLTSTAEEA